MARVHIAISLIQHVSTQPVPSLVCPVMVGRTHELDALERHLDGAGPPVVVVSGEAGIGKSRLIAEAKRRARRRGLQVLQGTCYESDRVLPYAPVLDLLRALFPTVSRKESAPSVDAAAAELAILLPGLSRRTPALVVPAIAEPAEHKSRVFYALSDLVAALAATSPLLVVVEDLHWSDETSLDFLAYLARHIVPYGHWSTTPASGGGGAAAEPHAADAPIRLLLSYRSDEPHPTLPHVVADLERERLAIELGLVRLTRDQLEAMVRAIFTPQHAMPADIVHMLHRLTDGNPFFVEEVLTSLVELGDLSYADGIWKRKPLDALRIPRTIHDTVQRRAAGLSEAARQVLTVAAVAGQRFDFTLLQHLTQRDETALLASIKELMVHQLVVEESADCFAFRHALTREAVYADLLARERRQIHRAIAEALQARAADVLGTSVGDLADHFYAAGVWDKALVYSQQAGEQALAVYAPRAAVEHFTRALHAAQQISVTAPPSLYRARGAAFEILGDFEHACIDYDTARQRARDTDDLQGEWQALLDLALLWGGRDYARVGDFVQRALEIARAAGDPIRLAHTLNRLGNWYTNVERPGEGLRCHQEALDIFEGLQDRRGLAETLDFLGMAATLAASPAQSAASYARAIPLLEEIDDRRRLVISLTVWGLQSGFYWSETTAPVPLNSADVTRQSERALQIARDMDWPAGVAFVLYERALWLGPRGQYAQALEVAQTALALAEDIAHQQWVAGALCALGALHLDLLDAPGAQSHFERALGLAREIGSLNWQRIATAFLAPTYLLHGEIDRAAAVLEAAIDDEAPMETVGQRLCWRARAQLALARGEAARALQILERLSPVAPLRGRRPRVPMGHEAGRLSLANDQQIVPSLWKLRGEALSALSRPDEAVQVLLAARDAAAAHGAGPLLWRIQVALGKLLQAHGHRTEAREAFAAARAVVQELAGNVPEGPLRSTFRQRATALLPPLRPTSPRRAAKERFDGLTAREREVALRIAEGKSNRAIAAEMVVAERTVEGYVGNILAKLAFTSRAQVAAWAVERGLTRGTE